MSNEGLLSMPTRLGIDVMSGIIIAIDGYSACGKSTTAREVARQLNYTYIDSGAMYRAVTLYFMQQHISPSNPHEVEKSLESITIHFKRDESGDPVTYLNGLNVEEEIRQMEVSKKVSEVSALHQVRHAMVAQQRKMGKQRSIVMDGRDIGSVVFKDAELKIFMVADFNVRIMRRQKELIEKGILIDFDEVKANLTQRDCMDSTREESPLIQAEDAVIINNTFMTFDEQVEEIIQLATGKIVQ